MNRFEDIMANAIENSLKEKWRGGSKMENLAIHYAVNRVIEILKPDLPEITASFAKKIEDSLN